MELCPIDPMPANRVQTGLVPPASIVEGWHWILPKFSLTEVACEDVMDLSATILFGQDAFMVAHRHATSLLTL